ncbi:MAG: glucosaminidase domain-containing protein [Anaerolineae bacterium]
MNKNREMERRVSARLALVCALLFLFGALAPTPPARAQGEQDFLIIAVPLAHKVQRATGVPSSVILAQSILESAWGRKPIPDANNYFGMKAFERPDGSINYGQIATGWTWAMTSEWDGAEYVSARERFRTYDSMADSFDDLGRLYSQNARYAAAMQQTGDPRQFAREVAKAGFATAPDYADRLLIVMDRQNLYQYDLKLDDAEFLDQSDYPTVHPGEAFEIYFELRNTGINNWNLTDSYHLQSVNGQTLGTDMRQNMSDMIPPGEVLRWTLHLVAPLQSGQYRTSWEMQHGEQWFGPELYSDITVEPLPSANARPVIVVTLLVIAAVLLLLSGYLLSQRARS